MMTFSDKESPLSLKIIKDHDRVKANDDEDGKLMREKQVVLLKGKKFASKQTTSTYNTPEETTEDASKDDIESKLDTSKILKKLMSSGEDNWELRLDGEVILCRH